MQQLHSIMEENGNHTPHIFVTDREPALRKAINAVFIQGRMQDSHIFLCGWHVNQNVLAHSKKHFRVGIDANDNAPKELHETFMKAWQNVVESGTEEAFEDNRRQLSEDERFPEQLRTYCERTWLTPYKREIVRCYTDQHPHFGHRRSSRIEGSHHVIKTYISNSTGDLNGVLDRLIQMWTNQESEWSVKIASAKISVPVSARSTHFYQLRGKISSYALNQIESTLKRVRDNIETIPRRCSLNCHYTTAWGLPCEHYLRNLHVPRHDHINNPKGLDGQFCVIELRMIHPHWFYDRSESRWSVVGAEAPQAIHPPPENPRRANSRPITHQRDGGAGTIRRDTIFSERVDQGLQQEGRRRRREDVDNEINTHESSDHSDHPSQRRRLNIEPSTSTPVATEPQISDNSSNPLPRIVCSVCKLPGHNRRNRNCPGHIRPVDHSVDSLSELPQANSEPETGTNPAPDFDASGALGRLGFVPPSWALRPGQRPTREFGDRHELSVEDIGVQGILDNADDEEEAEHLLWLTRRTFESRGVLPDPREDPHLSAADADALNALRAPRTVLNRAYQQQKEEMGRE